MAKGVHMNETSAEERKVGKKSNTTVDRETFRKVVRQRQKMKAELRQLQEKMSTLPKDWDERLPGWLEFERINNESVPEMADTTDQSAGGSEEPVEAEKAVETAGAGVDSRPEIGPVLEQSAEVSEWEEKERQYCRMIAELTLSGMIRETAGLMGAYDPQDVVDLTKDYFSATYTDGELKVSPGPALLGPGPGGEHHGGRNGVYLGWGDLPASGKKAAYGQGQLQTRIRAGFDPPKLPGRSIPGSGRHGQDQAGGKAPSPRSARLI